MFDDVLTNEFNQLWLVCKGPVYSVRRSLARLPHASDVATCKALAEPNGGIDDLLVAHFPAELPMQVDLHDGGYTWYAFAWDRGRMATFASRSEVEVSDPVTNLGETPALQPLKQFGFIIYSDPGP